MRIKKHSSLPLVATLLGAVITAVSVATVDTTRVTALTLEQYDTLRGAAPTEEQQETQEDVAEKAKEFIERFTQTEPIEDRMAEPTDVQVLPTNTMPDESFETGPVETLAEVQMLEEPVSALPDSGFGFPLAAVALGATALRYRKKLRNHLQ